MNRTDQRTRPMTDAEFQAATLDWARQHGHRLVTLDERTARAEDRYEQRLGWGGRRAS